ncbi:unnamed protein product, partial [Coregonus sp. 'balchen']
MLPAMRDAKQHGLDHMPKVDEFIAELMLSPDEALKDDARCPRPQCRATDELLSRAYDKAAYMTRIWKFLAVLMLAQNRMLQPEHADLDLCSLNDVSLQAFAFMTRELGRLMSTVVVTCRQVWFAQAPMSDDSRQMLRKLPVVLGLLFGPVAECTIKCTKQLSQTTPLWNAQPRNQAHRVVADGGLTHSLRAFPGGLTAAEPASQFCYLTDNHNSVVGIRGVTSALGVVSLPVSPEEIEARAKDVAQSEGSSCQTPHLFCYPAQSNFSGRKYSLGYVRGIQARQLYPACDSKGLWFVLLDAASFASCSPLDLQEHPADFVPFSFYKMFGFPTSLGALLVQNDTAALLRNTYFGGGTTAAYLAGENYYVSAPNMASRFEDVTISFLDIIALNHCFDSLHTFTRAMDKIQPHTFGLTRYTYLLLSSLCHGNGQPVAQIYSNSEFENPSTQGAILNFNLMDCHGQMIGYSQVDKLASLFNIHVRTGCFCNTGACQLFLGITNQEVKSNLQAGHVCGDNIDLVDNRPTGSVRVSFGYMSTFQDCQNVLNFVADCFVEKPVKVDQAKLDRLKSNTSSKGSSQCLLTMLTNGKPDHIDEREHASTDPVVTDWPVGALGLLHDRGWMVVNGNGVCLNQKREPRLCLIHPQIYLPSNTLLLQASGQTYI